MSEWYMQPSCRTGNAGRGCGRRPRFRTRAFLNLIGPPRTAWSTMVPPFSLSSAGSSSSHGQDQRMLPFSRMPTTTARFWLMVK